MKIKLKHCWFSCLWDRPGGSFGRGGRHQLRVWIGWAFPVLGLDAVIHILQQVFLGDGVLDAFTHSWRESSNTHTHTLEMCNTHQNRFTYLYN